MRNILFLTGILVPFLLTAQQIEKHISYGGEKIGFYEYKPSTYNSDPSEKYPLLIFLHGIGERGNGTSQLSRVKNVAIPRYIAEGNPMRFYKDGKWHSFIVLSPQCAMKYSMWPTLYVDALLEYAEKNLRIDKSRIYLTGLSMGGGGTWKYVSASQANASKFAAIATVCAPATLTNGCNIAQAKLPMWAFHAKDDNVVNVSALTNSLNKVLACNPTVKPLQTIWNNGGHAVWDRAYNTGHSYQNPNVFEWFLGFTRNTNDGGGQQKPPPNKAPMAAAGSDRTISAGSAAAVSLDASASYDTDGSIVAYTWTQIGGKKVPIHASNRAHAIAKNLDAGSYAFRITVTDNNGAKHSDDVLIKVTGSKPAGKGNAPPMANAGKSRTLPATYAKSVLLNATASRDPDGWINAFTWRQVSGPAAALESSNLAKAYAKNLKAGVYKFRVTVTDNKGLQSTADAVITVQADNKAPIAKVSDQSLLIHQPQNSVLLKGAASYDNDGYIAAFQWTKIAGPSSYRFENAKVGNTRVYDLSPGLYIFRLTVKDNKGTTGSKDVKVEVNALPVVKAGSDQAITLPRRNVYLNGFATQDPGGWIKSFRWTKISGPGSFTIATPSAVGSRVDNLTEGAYIFRLTATDGDGASAFDDVKVTVRGNYAANATLEPDSRPAAAGLSITPNPAQAYIRFTCNSEQEGKTTATIRDLSGHTVKTARFDKNSRSLTGEITVADLNAGGYILTITIGNERLPSQQFIKQ